jgi:hypothetical protein
VFLLPNQDVSGANIVDRGKFQHSQSLSRDSNSDLPFIIYERTDILLQLPT